MNDETVGKSRSGRVLAVALAGTLAAAMLATAPVGSARADESPPRTVVRVGDVSIVEGNSGRSAATVQVALSHPLDHDLVVAVVTRDGTATATAGAVPADYRAIAIPKSIKIAAGKTSAKLSVSVSGDTTAETDEQFDVETTGTTDSDVAGGATGRITIVDDDSAGGGTQLCLGAARVFEGPSGTATVKIPVTLSAPLDHDVLFNVYSSGGSANWPSDYKRIDKRIRIRAGKVSASVAVPIVGDVETENDEEFFLQIVDVSDQAVSTVAHGSASVVIRDDEPPLPPGNIYSYVFGNPVTLKGSGAPGWVHLAWDEPIGGGSADGYDLELSRDNATWQPLAATATATYDHFCGLYNQVCLYRVTPRNAGGSGPISFLGSIVTQAPAPPGPPASFTGDLVDPFTPGLIALQWSPPDTGGAVEAYRVEWHDSRDTWQEIYYGGGLATQHDCGLPAVECEYRLTATNTGGVSASRGTEVTVRTVPGTPVAVDAHTTPESHVISLSWLAPTSDGGVPVSGYAVRFTGDTDGTGQPPNGAQWTTIATTDRAATIDACGTAATGTASCWLQVRAENAVGPGPWSGGTAVATSVTAVPGALEEVGVALAGLATPGLAELTWTPGATGGAPSAYDVEMSRDGTSWQTIAHTTETHLEHYCGLYQLTCSYRVTPQNVGGAGPTGSLGSVTTESPPRPGPSARFTANLANGRGLVTLSWVSPSTGGPVESYRVERRIGLNSWQTIYLGADRTTQNDCGVPGLSCDYRVVAVNTTGDGPAVSVTITTEMVPAAPLNLVGSSQPESRVVLLQWAPRTVDGGSPILRYRVRMTTDIDADGQARWNSAWATSIVPAPSSSTFTRCTGGPRPLVRCRFEIQAENALGAGPWSGGAIVTTLVSAHDPKPDEDPKPSTG